MTTRFGFDLHPKDARWAAAESVNEDVIAAVLLLHKRPVDEIAPKLSPAELRRCSCSSAEAPASIRHRLSLVL